MKEPFSGEAIGKSSSGNFSRRRFFWMNNLFYRKKVLSIEHKLFFWKKKLLFLAQGQFYSFT